MLLEKIYKYQKGLEIAGKYRAVVQPREPVMGSECGCGFSWMGVEGELNGEDSWLKLCSLTVKCSLHGDTERLRKQGALTAHMDTRKDTSF